MRQKMNDLQILPDMYAYVNEYQGVDIVFTRPELKIEHRMVIPKLKLHDFRVWLDQIDDEPMKTDNGEESIEDFWDKHLLGC
jgi:hypothetical protein